MLRFPHNTVAVIPAAGVRRGLNKDASDAMITVSGKPAIFWTLQELIACRVNRICIIVKARENDLERFVRLTYESLVEIVFVVPDQLCGVGYSVVCGINALKSHGCPTLVVLGDTIFAPRDFTEVESSWVSVAEVEDQSRWCMAMLEDRYVTQLFDKPRSGVLATHACTGIYFFKDGVPFDEKKSFRISDVGGRLEMSDLLRPIVERRQLTAQITSNWLDVGNADHLQDARRKLVQSRSFNSLILDPTRGTITKRSTYTSKFYDEINYFKLLPETLKVYFPRVLDCSNLPGEQFITMEYYAYPTLADLFLFDELPVSVWRKIFQRLRLICDEFCRYDYGTDSVAAISLYCDKNIGRFRSYLATTNDLASFFLSGRRLTVNGAIVPNPNVVIDKSAPLLEKIAASARWTPIHGDLCFSNILCEPDSSLVKLLDPRGSFGKQGVLGDARYDLAKLTHSVIGRYDFIVNDLFVVRVDAPGELVLDMPFRVDMRPIVNEFEAIFLADRALRDEVLLITAWLFLSMLPLHGDNPRRQLAMLATGLKIFSEISE